MASPVSDSDRFSRLHALLSEGGDDLPSLTRMCERGADHLSLAGAGVSVVTSTGVRGVVLATDEVSARIEELQVSLGEGPCIDVWTQRSPVVEPNLSSAQLSRWPGFAPAAREAGAEAVFSLPLQVGRTQLGAMDVYRATPGELSAADLHDAVRLCDAVAQMLVRIEAGEPGRADTDDLETGQQVLPAQPTFTSEIYQASGMVMVQLDVDVTEAMARLRAHAFAQGRSLAEVAHDVVGRRLRLERDR